MIIDQVPLLCIDGLKLEQSMAVVRYLAEKHKPRRDGSPAHAVKCDMGSEMILDWKNGIGGFNFQFNGFEPSE